MFRCSKSIRLKLSIPCKLPQASIRFFYRWLDEEPDFTWMKSKLKNLSSGRETWIIFIVVGCGIIATLSWEIFESDRLRSSNSNIPQGQRSEKEMTSQSKNLLSATTVPLATGEEPLDKLFIQSGCPVCHTIPGIQGAQGRQGPQLQLGTTGPQRLADPQYSGKATTVREYIIESILTPGAYVVPGYRDEVMPRWYGKKLSALALQKIATYLESIPAKLQ